MPRKNSKSAKSITTDKKFTTVPPKAKPVVAPSAAVAAVVAAPVVAETKAVVAETKPAVVTDLKPLIEALHDVNADVASEAATALGASNNPAAVEPLIEILTNANGYFHSVVRSAAAVSLGQLKDRRSVEALLAAVHDPIADPSTEAIRALTKLADPRAIGALVEVVRNSNGFFANSVRRAAVLGLAKLGGDTAVAELRLVAADESEDSVIRHEASEAIKSR